MPVVDTSIYNSKGIDPGQFGSGYEEGVKLKDMQQLQAQRAQQMQMEGINLDKAQREQQSQILQRGVVKFDPVTGQPSMDNDAFSKYAQFDPNGAMALKQQQQQQQVAAQKAQLELHHMQLGDMSDILRPGLQSESAYRAAVKQATDKGYLHPGELPDSYAAAVAKDPTTGISPLEAHINQALSLQDVLKEKHETIGDTAKTTEAAAKTKDANTNAQKLPIEKKKADAEIALMGPKLKGEMYGRSSPTNAMAGEYEKEVQPIRSSQVAMRQMLDNYHNPSPQGDRSLILNAFKIKFPTAPDVNSLEELSKAQSLPEQWRNNAYAATHGGLDQNTRDNLMRDGISTYRANYGTYKDIAKRYEGMANDRGVPLGGLTREPSLDSTFDHTEKLQQKLNPHPVDNMTDDQVIAAWKAKNGRR